VLLFLLFVACLFSFSELQAQKFNSDSLWAIWNNPRQVDTNRVNALHSIIYNEYAADKPDSGIYLAQLELDFARKIKNLRKEGMALNNLGLCYRSKGDLDLAEKSFNESFTVQQKAGFALGMSYPLYNLSDIYNLKGDLNRAIAYQMQGLQILRKAQLNDEAANTLSRIGELYFKNGQLDSGALYIRKCYDYYASIKDSVTMSYKMAWLAWQFQGVDQVDSAIFYRYKSISISQRIGLLAQTMDDYRHLINLYRIKKEITKSIESGREIEKFIPQLKDTMQLMQACKIVGQMYYDYGLYGRALRYYLKVESIPTVYFSQNQLMELYTLLGTLYEEAIRDYEKALIYYKKSTALTLKTEDKSNICIALINEGTINGYLKEFNKAIKLLSQAERLVNDLEDEELNLIITGRLGMVYANKGDRLNASKYYAQLAPLLNNLNDGSMYYGYKAEFLSQMGMFHFQNKDMKKAIAFCEQGLKTAEGVHDFARQKLNCTCLYKVYSELGSDSKALQYLRTLISINDTIEQRQAEKRFLEAEFEKKFFSDSLANEESKRKTRETHLSALRQGTKNRNIAIGTGFFFLLLAGGFYLRWRFVQKSKIVLQLEKDRSEKLLLNILPSEIAEELKLNGKAEARDFDMVSILFSDFKGFTELSAKLSASDLVGEINTCFIAFDHIIGKYQIEKIKTIGDSYMAAGGIPVPMESSVKNTVLAALEMQAFIKKRGVENARNGLPAFEMRVGIHTGQVVAGIVGVKKFQYDIWGDTVNTASRMESSGEVGRVNVSQATHEMLKDDKDFIFTHRGKIEAKGKGTMHMWFVSLADTT
jgi:class 3 adenylate cyclase